MYTQKEARADFDDSELDMDDRYIPSESPPSQEFIENMEKAIDDATEGEKSHEALVDEMAGYVTPTTTEEYNKVLDQQGLDEIFLGASELWMLESEAAQYAE